MNIGFMRNYRNPSYLTKLVAIYSRAYNINLIYLRPRDVDPLKENVNGRMLINNNWEGIQTRLPPFIDISPYCFKAKNKKVLDYLRENTLLSDNGLNKLNKEELQERLKKDKNFEQLIIPTNRVESFETFERFLMDYKQVILKPISGQFGQDVFYLEDNKGKFTLKHSDTERVLSYVELKSFFETEIRNKSFIVQKYIASKNKQGYPFDCRINMEKNKNGEWVVARMFVRIGIGQSVVSNISQGGAVSSIKSFLQTNFQEKWKDILEKLNTVSLKLPHKIEELRQTELMTLGIDIGIDKEGEIYLFETNSAPGTTQLRAQVAMYRAEYYKYIINRNVAKRNLVCQH